MSLAAVILAAGGSTRMGQAKQLLPVGGKSLVVHAIDAALGAHCSPIILVLGASADAIVAETDLTGVQAVLNADWEKGMGTSIRVGVSALLHAHPTSDRLVLLLCDQPGVTAETIRQLDLEQAKQEKLVCAAEYANTIGPPVIVTGPFVEKLMELPDASGAKALWQGQPDLIATCPCPEAAQDVDTPAEYAAVNDHPIT